VGVSRWIVRKPRIKASATSPILDTLERNVAGYTFAACRSRAGSLCRVRAVSGSVHEPQEAMIRRTDSEQGYFHSRVSYPTSDLEVDF
jgi:hypothetical protein